jgi:hypothetical protein
MRYFVGIGLTRYTSQRWSNLRPVSEFVPAKYKADLDLFKKYADQVDHTNPLNFNVNRVYAHLIEQRAHRPKIEEKQPLISFAETWLHLAGDHMSAECRNVMWQAAHGILPVAVFIQRFLKNVNVVCTLCGAAPETRAHLFVECTEVKAIYDLIKDILMVEIPQRAADIILLRLGVDSAVKVIIISELIYTVWSARNRVRVNNTKVTSLTLLSAFKGRLRTRLHADLFRLKTVAFEATWHPLSHVFKVIDDGLVFTF